LSDPKLSLWRGESLCKAGSSIFYKVEQFTMFLSQINIYLIKSLRGISLKEVKFDGKGLKFDRRWMLVDERNCFLTQRQYPKMATIGTKVEDGF
jgi:uncharacterized protein YcbX